jgi:hypothetical protein
LIKEVSIDEFRRSGSRNFCLLTQPLGNAGPKPADAERLDQLVTDAMLPA